MAELVDALDLGSSGETRPGSSPGFRMLFSCIEICAFARITLELNRSMKS